MIWDIPPKIWLPTKPAIIRPAPVQTANFLPGTFPGVMMAGSAGGPPTTLSFQASATSTGSTITGPSSIQAGDLLVLSDIRIGPGSPPTAVVPSGFTSTQSSVSGGAFFSQFRHILSYKIADGSEASASLTGMAGDGGSKILFVFRPDNPITTVTPASGGAQATTGNPTSQTVAASGGTPPLVIIGAYATVHGDTVTIDPRTFTPAKTDEVRRNAVFGTIDHWLAYRVYDSSPADTSIDMDDEGDENSLLSRYFSVS